MQSITSKGNARVKYAGLLAASAAFRQAEGLFFAEGLRLCQDLAQVLKPVAVFATGQLLQRQAAVATLMQGSKENYEISQAVAEKLAETKTTQGLFCLFETPKTSPAQLYAGRAVLMCEDVQDPANVGALLRSAAALGMSGVVLSPKCADPFCTKALRAGMGAAARIAIAQRCALPVAAAALQKNGSSLFAATLQNAVPLPQLQVQGAFALLVGNEGAGLSQEAVKLAAQRVYIPMFGGMQSLNVAAAAAIIMHSMLAKCAL